MILLKTVVSNIIDSLDNVDENPNAASRNYIQKVIYSGKTKMIKDNVNKTRSRNMWILAQYYAYGYR